MEFNAVTPDSPLIYYQSYASVMGCALSDYILTVPYLIGRMVGSKKNDGLVPEPSAHWGEFKGVLQNKRIHGVSHGDLIDLKRDDYRGFDILSMYVDIVADLKQKGF
jgi:triacylglycerol lipase